jgi:N-acetylmuramoyl-L-alanine amidase
MTDQPRVPRYRVEFVKGDYTQRQMQANRMSAALYFEGHANASTDPNADYALGIVATNASTASIDLAARLARGWAAAFDAGLGYGTGVRHGGHGDGNLKHTKMPAVLGEPVFASNRRQALLAETDEGIDRIAGVLVDAIRDTVPDGALIVLSVGHIGKQSAPRDRGAPWSGVRFTTEAAFASAYLARAAALLRQGAPVFRETDHA